MQPLIKYPPGGALPSACMHLKMRVLAEAIKRDESTAHAMGLECFALLCTTITARLPARNNDRGEFLSRDASP